MKSLFSLILVLLLAGCSAPKYTYRFAPSPYLASISGDGSPASAKIKETESSEVKTVLVASAEPPASIIVPSRSPVSKKMGKAIGKLKETAKTIGNGVAAKTKKLNAPAPADVDNELKFSIIFGAAGIVALLLLVVSKVFGIIGGIALIVATIYFAKWVLKQ